MRRNQRVYELSIPETTKETVVFPFNALYNKFIKSHYKSSMTNYRIKDEELNRFLADLEEQIKTYIKQCGRETMLKYFCLVFILIAIVAFIIGLHSIDAITDSPYKVLLPLSLCFLALGLLTFFWFALRFIIKTKNLMLEVSKLARTYVNEKGKEFEARGFTWVIPSLYPTWIELRKNKLVTNETTILTNNHLGDYHEGEIRSETASHVVTSSQQMSALVGDSMKTQMDQHKNTKVQEIIVDSGSGDPTRYGPFSEGLSTNPSLYSPMGLLSRLPKDIESI